MNEDLIEVAREFLKAIQSDTAKYISDSGEIKEADNSITLFTPSHIQFAKYGRGPGKQPPVDPLIEWCQKENIDFAGSVEATGWAIAKSIAKHGTINYLPNAPFFMEELIEKYMDQYLQESSGIVTLELNEELKKLDILPEKIEFKI